MAGDWPLELRFTITEQDLVDSSRLAAQPLFRLVAVLSLVLIAGGALLFLLRPGGTIGPAFVIAGVITFIASRVGYVSRWAVRRRLGKILGSDCVVRFDDSGVEYRQTGMSGRIEWSALTGIREDSRMLFLMQGGVQRFGLPKRLFADAGSLAAFLQEVERRAGS